MIHDPPFVCWQKDGTLQVRLPPVDDALCRAAWARYAAKQHAWMNGAVPPMVDGRFETGWHEAEYQIFRAGACHGRS